MKTSTILRMSVFCPLKANADVRAITFSLGIFARALMISSDSQQVCR
jgi:hypothetical protein